MTAVLRDLRRIVTPGGHVAFEVGEVRGGKLLLEDVSPAAQWVEYVWDIRSPALLEKVQELVALVEKGCHTINTLREPVPVTALLKFNGADVPVSADG